VTSLLFRSRQLTGLAVFLVVFWFGHPATSSVLWSVPLLLAGLAMRVWAMSYIGPAARTGRFEADALVQSGPYRQFRLHSKALSGHPLYVGNFLLVLGGLVALSPHVLVSVAVLVGFLVEYYLFAKEEDRLLVRKFGAKPASPVPFQARNAIVEWRTLATIVLLVASALAKARFFRS
jgi:protein-S-isoprenylcysteine O-methyltransferase Ste14